MIIEIIFLFILIGSFVGFLFGLAVKIFLEEDWGIIVSLVCALIFILCVLVILLIIQVIIQEWLCQICPTLFQCPT
ncbi:MAG: hypothetical protein WC533_00810 [Candidatus Pacearchaeota archaeon]